jgi:hypothetical protein
MNQAETSHVQSDLIAAETLQPPYQAQRF